MNLRYDVYIFDFDGTLVQSNAIKYETFFIVTSEFQNSEKIITSIIESNSKLTRNEIFKEFVLKLPIKIRKDQLAEILTEKYSLICEDQIVLAPEVLHATKMLEQLKQYKKNIFVSSATPKTYLDRILKKRKLFMLFDGIYGAPFSKNVHINKIKSIIKIDTKKIVYIGDSTSDQLAARNAGCDFIGIGNDESRFINKPKHLMRDFKNFIKYLKLT